MKLFDSVRVKSPSRNKFNLSHERKFSFNMGDLVPMFVEEVVPGDSWRNRSEIMLRLAPMLAPVMHRVNVKTEFFFVPFRLIWDEFEEFITGGRLGTSAPVMPHANAPAFAALSAPGSLADYLGLPDLSASVGDVPGVSISVLKFRAYQLIYDEYYRDQSLTAPVDILKTSGEMAAPEVAKLTTMRKRAWEKDYFTSALPFAQRGAAVGIPFGDAEIEYEPQTKIFNTADGSPYGSGNPILADVTTEGTVGTAANAAPWVPGNEIRLENIASIAVSGNINDLRRSIRLQEWLELAARVGGRYVEVLKGFFDVKPDDARLQRPEFLGGGVTPVRISEVLSTVQQVDSEGEPVGNPQGDMSGHGLSIGNQNSFSRFFKEHGLIIGLISVLPKTAYQQGLHKSWSRFDKYDFYWKQFAQIGEQEVRNKELYFTGDNDTTEPEGLFGYQSRYAEYKYACSTVHGDFKTSLAYWHMGRIFGAEPDLDTSFVESDPTHRIFAVDDPAVHKLWCHLYHDCSTIRPMPYFGTPTL